MDIETILDNLVNLNDDPEEMLEILEPIGDGSYGYVYKAIDKIK